MFRTRPRAGAWALLAAGAALVVGLSVIIAPLVRHSEQSSVDEVKCGDTLSIEGTLFEKDDVNDGRIQVAALANEMGVVAARQVCGSPDDGLGIGFISASVAPLGAVVYALPGVSSTSRVAVVVQDQVHVYRRLNVSTMRTELQGLSTVGSVELQSMADGTGRVLVIDESARVEALVREINHAPSISASVRRISGNDPDLISVRFVLQSGLVVEALYRPSDRVLSTGLQLGPQWGKDVPPSTEP